MDILAGLMNVIDTHPGCGFVLRMSYDGNRWWCDVHKRSNSQVELSLNLDHDRNEEYVMTAIEQLRVLIEID